MIFPVFCCDCGLTDEEVMDDLKMVIKLTGSETDAELQHLHLSTFHSEDHWEEDENPTARELKVDAKARQPTGQERCEYCPPYEQDNAGLAPRKSKHGAKKPRYKDKR